MISRLAEATLFCGFRQRFVFRYADVLNTFADSRGSIEVSVTDAADSKILIKSRAADVAACATIVALCLFFYLPETGALESRYMYYPDCFERAAELVYPEYPGDFYRTSAEGMRPFMTLCARPILAVFRDNPAAAVAVLHVGMALIAGLLTYAANRYFFSPAPALYIAVLLMFDRCLMPVARGLGMMGVLLLPPLLLIILRQLIVTQDRAASRGRRIRSAIGMAIAGGVICLLGGHETVYSIAFLAGGIVLSAVVWIARSIRIHRAATGLSLFTLTGLAGMFAVGCLLVVVLYFSIPAERRHADFVSVLTQQHYRSNADYDVTQELAHAASRWVIWKDTFWDGRYSAQYGAWHRNTFLYPGSGFNGIIPLVVLPGFIVGLWLWGWRLLRVFRPRKDTVTDASQDSLALFNAVLLAVFVAVALVSSDPKPTRYSPCIFAIFALSASGYERVYLFLRSTAERKARPGVLVRFATLALLLAVAVPIGLRVHKNYRDLQRYCSVFRFEITTYGLPPQLRLAQTEYADRPTYFVARRWLGPDVGLLLRYRRPEHIRFVSRSVFDRPSTRAALPEDAVVFLREDLDDESKWRYGPAAEFKPR